MKKQKIILTFLLCLLFTSSIFLGCNLFNSTSKPTDTTLIIPEPLPTLSYILNVDRRAHIGDYVYVDGSVRNTGEIYTFLIVAEISDTHPNNTNRTLTILDRIHRNIAPNDTWNFSFRIRVGQGYTQTYSTIHIFDRTRSNAPIAHNPPIEQLEKISNVDIATLTRFQNRNVVVIEGTVTNIGTINTFNIIALLSNTQNFRSPNRTFSKTSTIQRNIATGDTFNFRFEIYATYISANPTFYWMLFFVNSAS